MSYPLEVGVVECMLPAENDDFPQPPRARPSQDQLEQLNLLAHRNLVERLEQFGNRLTDKHNDALRHIIRGFTEQAFGSVKERRCYPLPCGAGKTLGLVTWIATATRLQLRLDVAVATATVNAQCDIYDAMVAHGVNPNLVSIVHSKGKNARHPCTTDTNRPILLLTHSKLIRSGEDMTATLTGGRYRDLIFWDESLIDYSTQHLALVTAYRSIEDVQRGGGASKQMIEALSYAKAKIEAQHELQRKDSPSSPLRLNEGHDYDELRKEIPTLRFIGSESERRSAKEGIAKLLNMLADSVAVALPKHGTHDDGLIQFRRMLSDKLDSIAVLDASAPVRLAAFNELGSTSHELFAVKRYDNVSIKQVLLPASVSTLRQHPNRLEEVAEIAALTIRETPTSDSILIFTAKGDDQCGLQRRFKASLRRQGVDIEEKVDDKPRISWLTWGNEASSNDYGHCQHILMLGLLRRSVLNLTAIAAAQRDDVCYVPTTQEWQLLQRTELAHSVLQGLNRGCSRQVDERGMARAMSVTIVDAADGLEGVLKPVMPGVRWNTSTPVGRSTRTQAAADAIVIHLLGLPCPTIISVQKLKSTLKIDLSATANRQAIDVALTNLTISRALKGGPVWRKVAGSLVSSGEQK